jgi:outer membrane protein TolC
MSNQSESPSLAAIKTPISRHRRNRFNLFTNRYNRGVDTYLQVINAQTIELANERNAISIDF